jgi:AcrR family transcriptional regulator
MDRRPPGRPRSEQARRAVLDATVGLIEESGYGRLTIDAIARRARVSRQTVYRWWPAKAEIVLEALNDAASAIAPAPDTGSLETDLRTLLRSTIAGATGRNARMLAALMAEAQFDEAFAESFRRDFLARRRRVLRETLERGRARGEIGASADLDFLVELAFGTLWYRILSHNARLDRRFADQLTDTLLALAAKGLVAGSRGVSRAGPDSVAR